MRMLMAALAIILAIPAFAAGEERTGCLEISNHMDSVVASTVDGYPDWEWNVGPGGSDYLMYKGGHVPMSDGSSTGHIHTKPAAHVEWTWETDNHGQDGQCGATWRATLTP
jgi:hypothetical protein